MKSSQSVTAANPVTSVLSAWRQAGREHTAIEEARSRCSSSALGGRMSSCSPCWSCWYPLPWDAGMIREAIARYSSAGSCAARWRGRRSAARVWLTYVKGALPPQARGGLQGRAASFSACSV